MRVDIATGYRLEAEDPFLAGQRNFSHLHSAQTGSGDHPDSYVTDRRELFPKVKAAGA
jgi:hypothetical protein